MQNDNAPAILPMLAYEDGNAAMDWLCKAFGFTESLRMLDDHGKLAQGAVRFGNGEIMIASPTPAYQSPKHHREVCEAAAAWNKSPYIINGVLVYVENIQSHFDMAKQCGAVMLSEIEYGFPGPRYRCEDLEGQRWMFLEKEKRPG